MDVLRTVTLPLLKRLVQLDVEGGGSTGQQVSSAGAGRLSSTARPNQSVAHASMERARRGAIADPDCFRFLFPAVFLQGALELKVVKRGARPLGGGEVQLRVPYVKHLAPIQMTDEGAGPGWGVHWRACRCLVASHGGVRSQHLSAAQTRAWPLEGAAAAPWRRLRRAKRGTCQRRRRASLCFPRRKNPCSKATGSTCSRLSTRGPAWRASRRHGQARSRQRWLHLTHSASHTTPCLRRHGQARARRGLLDEGVAAERQPHGGRRARPAEQVPGRRLHLHRRRVRCGEGGRLASCLVRAGVAEVPEVRGRE